MKTNEEVINSWIRGMPEFGKGIKTNGKDLFSSGFKIGITGDDKDKLVYNYKDEFFVSDTITRHVDLALKVLGLNAGVKPPCRLIKNRNRI